VIGGQPSQTSLVVAAARAAHLIVDKEPWLFSDPVAGRLLGRQREQLMANHRMFPTLRALAGLRAEATCRSRYTEERLASAVERGIGQYIVLGAGLDTFAYRSPLVGDRLRVFEVDHPATQEWKRRALAAAGVAVPGGLTFVPVNFESQRLVDRLVSDGFDRERPAFVSCLGVTVYLTRAAIGALFSAVGSLAEGSEFAVDHVLPRELLDREGRRFVDSMVPQVAASGEPWRSPLAPDEVSALLRRHGFASVRHVQQRDMVDPALWQRRDSLRPTGTAAIAHATIGPPA
jgi:methyltransferase (TIGR00027 family)